MSKDAKSNYYDAGGIEVLDVIKAKLTPIQYQGYLLGNAIKYQLRMMHKTPDDPTRDAEKAANYSRWLDEELKEQHAPVMTSKKSPTVHIGIDMLGALKRGDHHLEGILVDNNRELTAAEVRAIFNRELAKGYTIFCECDNRRADGGCAGHGE